MVLALHEPHDGGLGGEPPRSVVAPLAELLELLVVCLDALDGARRAEVMAACLAAVARRDVLPGDLRAAALAADEGALAVADMVGRDELLPLGLGPPDLLIE